MLEVSAMPYYAPLCSWWLGAKYITDITGYLAEKIVAPYPKPPALALLNTLTVRTMQAMSVRLFFCSAMPECRTRPGAFGSSHGVLGSSNVHNIILL